jgi:small-conductance mechanosensitive channel
MKNSTVHSMLREVWEDLQRPETIWQLFALALCLMLAYALAQGIRARLKVRARLADEADGMAEHGLPGLAERAVSLRVGAVSRVLFPLLASAFLGLAKPILAVWFKTTLLHLALVLMASMALIRLAVYMLRRVASNAVLSFLEKWLAFFVWSAFALYVTGIWVDAIDLFERVQFPVGRGKVSLWTFMQGTAWVLGAMIVALWAGASLEARLMQSAAPVNSSVRAVIGRLLKALLVLLGLLLSLSIAGLDLTVLSVFGGALGVGLGLGLQRIASNYVSGFIILLDRSVRIGDLITVDKYQGRVTEIRTRYSRLKTSDGTEAIVPNELLVNAPVQNHTAEGRRAQVSFGFRITHASDLEHALVLTAQTASQDPRVMVSPAPRAVVTEFATEGIGIALVFWIADPDLKAEVLSDLARQLLRLFREQSVEIPGQMPDSSPHPCPA